MPTKEPYEIAYRALVPKRAQAERLLVSVSVSSSHIAFGSIRKEPVLMILGQLTATAAALSLEKACAVHALPYGEPRARLLAEGQVLQSADKIIAPRGL